MCAFVHSVTELISVLEGTGIRTSHSLLGMMAFTHSELLPGSCYTMPNVTEFAGAVKMCRTRIQGCLSVS